MTRLCLPVRIADETAARQFSRPRPGNLFGLLARRVQIAVPGSPATRVPPFIERLWMPAYAIRLHAVSNKSAGAIGTSVEGISGEFSLLDAFDELASRELEEECFPPALTEGQAAELARKGLLRVIMAQRGQFNKPVVDAVEEIRMYHFPVWACYLRRGKSLDLKVLDAYTGKPGGAKLRAALLNALVTKRKARG